MNEKVIWIIIPIVAIFLQILIFYFIVPKKILGNKKTLDDIEDFKRNSKTVRGYLDNYICFIYSILSYVNENLHTVDYYMYLPIVKYINNYGNEEYIIVQNIEKFKNLGENVFKYEDLGKEIIVNIDETNSKNMEIDLEKGYFIDKVYTQIKIGDSTEVKKGIFKFDVHEKGKIGQIVEAKLYSAKIEENLLNYLTNIRVVPGIVSELNHINIIEKTRKNTKKFLNIFGLICIIVTIIISIYAFSIVNKIP